MLFSTILRALVCEITAEVTYGMNNFRNIKTFRCLNSGATTAKRVIQTDIETFELSGHIVSLFIHSVYI